MKKLEVFPRLRSSQGHEESEVSGAHTADYGLIVVVQTIKESSSNEGEGREAIQGEEAWCSEGRVSQHSGRETEATGLDLVGVRASVHGDSKCCTDGTEGKELREGANTNVLAQVGTK